MARKSSYEQVSRAPVQVVMCGHEGCQQPAMTREGNTPICRWHWDGRNRAEDRQWLLRNRVIREGMTTPERMKALDAYRKKIKREGKPDPLAWAHRIRSDHFSGERLLRVQVELASKALREDWTADEERAAA